jgi:hypothetical protein
MWWNSTRATVRLGIAMDDIRARGSTWMQQVWREMYVKDGEMDNTDVCEASQLCRWMEAELMRVHYDTLDMPLDDATDVLQVEKDRDTNWSEVFVKLEEDILEIARYNKRSRSAMEEAVITIE